MAQMKSQVEELSGVVTAKGVYEELSYRGYFYGTCALKL